MITFIFYNSGTKRIIGVQQTPASTIPGGTTRSDGTIAVKIPNGDFGKVFDIKNHKITWEDGRIKKTAMTEQEISDLSKDT